jgi:P-type conjugative transfer protein TrbG
MSRKGYLHLALLALIAAGTAAANQADSDSPPPGKPADAAVPNIPPELSDPPQAPPANALASPGPSADPDAQTPPATAAQNCVNPDCAAPVDKPGKAKPTPPVYIGPPAQRALAESHAWAENPNAMPTRDSGGRVIFTFNDSAPTVVCAPLMVCDIELQAGEVVVGVPRVGDTVRWRIAPAISGTDDHKTIHLVVKPIEAGLSTNLIVPTDRRTYHLRLVSSFDRYVTSVAFFYPEEDQQAWKEFDKAGAHGGSGVTGPAADDMPTVAVNRLNFDYKIKVVKGKPLFKPLRAMDDGYHTWIAMNEDIVQGEAPALIGISRRGEEQMINYRLKRNLYVIDGVVYKLALVTGVGPDQQRIELQRQVCQRRGWLGICWDPKE